MKLLSSLILLLTMGLLGNSAWAAGSGGGGGPVPTTSGTTKSPEQIARAQYKYGLKQKGKALRAQEQALAAKSDKKRAKFEKRANKAFTKAADHYKKVLQADPRHYKAANELGYALRKSGDFRNAVGAYNYALQMKPDFLEAIEYRGEAFIALGYFNEARSAYLRLYREDQNLAIELMAAMTQWVETRSDQAEPLNEAEQGFADWITERQRLVGFSANPAAEGRPGVW
ncbi:MAG: tetratricopeptide repeat protein [Pseudomonadales bacterium]